MTAHRNAEVAAAYAHCRAIARREAKNFYYAFRVLPRRKSDAMCAVYAFMRKADDLADDESFSVEERRAMMAQWTERWRASRGFGVVVDPVFVAVRDVQEQFQILDELLDQLVAGTTLDLAERADGVASVSLATTVADTGKTTYQVWETFDALYRYCYLVASVVGLVSIRIFEYSDPQAELLAEQTGVAFQLTNILRDVREDAERGRVYLPMDDMKAVGCDVESIVAAAKGAPPRETVGHLLHREIERARGYYRASDALIPMLAADAQPAMRVLVEIYRRLLERIAVEPVAVFRERISVPTQEKLSILATGAIGSLKARVLR